jgi:hypothetical protein
LYVGAAGKISAYSAATVPAVIEADVVVLHIAAPAAVSSYADHKIPYLVQIFVAGYASALRVGARAALPPPVPSEKENIK